MTCSSMLSRYELSLELSSRVVQRGQGQVAVTEIKNA